MSNFINKTHIDIIVVSELWLKPDENFVLKGFNLIKKCRIDGHGGVGIFIRQGIFYTEVDIIQSFNKDLEVCAITLSSLNISIVSLYRPSDIAVNYNDWINLIQQFDTNSIFCGDFNAHHGMWGPIPDDRHGKILADAIDYLELVVLNDGTPTRVNPMGNHSAVDISFTSHVLVDRLAWEVLDDTMGSDHYPIVIGIQINPKSFTVNPSTKWNDSRADWDTFHKVLEADINQLLTGNNTNLTDKVAAFFEIISSAADRSMPVKKAFTPVSPRPIWWDEECVKMVEKRKTALKNYRIHSNYNNYIIYQNLAAQAKRLFKNKQRGSWINFLNKLNKNTPLTEIWKFVKRLNNKSFQCPKKPISKDLIDDILNKIAPPSASNFGVKTDVKFIFNHEDELLASFTIHELGLLIKKGLNTSPGVDGFTYKIINNLPISAKNFLLQLFNDWWRKQKYSDCFKNIIVCLILKPNKDPGLSSSFCPISLISCITKTFERLIKIRLEYFVESRSLLPNIQYGFRRGRGTIDAVSHLVSDIQISFSKNYYTLCLFVDLTGAYDVVDLNILANKMENIGINKTVSTNIINIFHCRKIFIRDHNNVLHGPHIVYNGLPQGSILSPILFNIYTADLHRLVDDKFNMIQYADDLCFYFTRSSYEQCLEDLGECMQLLISWFNDMGFSVSQDKTALVCFTRHRVRTAGATYLAGFKIPFVDEFKYLGIILDKKLLWTNHIKYVKKNVKKV